MRGIAYHSLQCRIQPQGHRLTRNHCSIHLDLLAANHIPDPFIGLNESKLQWLHDKTWIYTTTFEGTVVRQDECVDLVFDGLDTFATVKLNGSEILKYAPNAQVGSIR